MSNTRVIAFMVALMVFAAASGVFAQATGTFTGRVVDQDGGVLPGTTVSATARATGAGSRRNNQRGGSL